MHAGYFLYISSDDYVPYVGEGLGDNEILISNSMGEVEFYRYRLLEDGSVVAVGAKDGVEVLGAFNDSLATTHADFLTQFGQELVTSA